MGWGSVGRTVLFVYDLRRTILSSWWRMGRAEDDLAQGTITTKVWPRLPIATLRGWWAAHRAATLRGAVWLMAVLALLKLGDEFRRLVWEQGQLGAVDLKHFHTWAHQWFTGESIYNTGDHDYLLPPASYPLLWPLLGWLELSAARWVWAATAVAALIWSVHLIVGDSGAETRSERIFVALLLLSMNATGIAIGNGQLIVHLLPLLVATMVLLSRPRGGWGRDVLAAVVFLAALVKPSVSVPFFWLVVFLPNSFRPAMLVTLGYGALTVFAASYQRSPFWPLMREWIVRGAALGTRAGYANLNIWMAGLGLEAWALPASLIALIALGIWVYRYRHVDLWLLIGVSALAARLWAYHRAYDDLLVLLPMVALMRIAKRGPSGGGDDVLAGALLGISLIVMLAPARLGFDSSPWVRFYNVGHTLVWLTMLLFLLERARRERTLRTD